jgi:signal transduction histidine kinase
MAEATAENAGSRRSGKFSRRLGLAFAAVAALTVGLAAAMLTSAWNYQFDQYARGNLQRIADGVAQILDETYPEYGGWTLSTLSTIPRFGTARGIGVQVLNDSGEVIYDDLNATHHADTSATPTGVQFMLKPKGTIVSAPVIVNGQQVGAVRVWAYGAGALLTDRDQQFRRASFIVLAIAAVLAIIVASIGGSWYAGRMVEPIERITRVAQAMRAGDHTVRTELRADDEIGLLGRTFDQMADAIEADRELERRLTADVAHELRTPLQAIQATVEAMQDGVLPADEERLGIVRDETVRLGRLTEAILELTRLERGSLPFVMHRIDLAQPVRSAIDAHQALIESTELVLSADVAEGIYVSGDADRLQQAVGNLLSNAARYTPPHGRIEVRVRAENGQAVIEVADTGIGIADDDIPHVFSRFWRADEARASSSGGLGIGLAVTKEIVERHRGSIGVARRDSGGTVFTIRIPRT